MKCNSFECIYMDSGECEPMGGECIGDLCENWGECSECQKEDGPEECRKGRRK